MPFCEGKNRNSRIPVRDQVFEEALSIELFACRILWIRLAGVEYLVSSPIMKVPKKTPSDHYVRSLARGLAVIRTFGADAPSQTLTQVAAKTGLDRAGARRILLTLEGLGYVRREGRSFFPTPSILHLGYSYLGTVPRWSVAERKMIELVDTVQESAVLGVLTKSHIVSVVCVHAQNLLTINLAVGRRSPAHCTAIGRVLLGALPESDLIRALKQNRPAKITALTVTSIPQLVRIIQQDHAKGWSLVDREYNESVSAIAVPVLSPSGQLIAAMSVIGTPIRTSPEKMIQTILPHLQHTAKTLWE
jgi:IclR family pca regulon transcriptional regulator